MNVAETNPLTIAIDEGNINAVRRILRDRGDLAQVLDGAGHTPLMRAALCPKREVEVIAALLDAGAVVNEQSAAGYTALHCAIDVPPEIGANARAVLSTLVTAGADLRLRQRYGWTPLLCAIARGKVVETRCLLALGADSADSLPAKTVPAFAGGRNALMLAVTSRGCEDLVAALLAAGADPYAPDADGEHFFRYLDALAADPGKCAEPEAVARCSQIAHAWLAQRSRQARRGAITKAETTVLC